MSTSCQSSKLSGPEFTRDLGSRSPTVRRQKTKIPNKPSLHNHCTRRIKINLCQSNSRNSQPPLAHLSSSQRAFALLLHHHLKMATTQISPLFRLLTPLLQTIRPTITASSSSALRHIPTTSTSTTSSLVQRNGITTSTSAFARPKGNVQKTDPRISLIRYHLQHPKTPRPLRLSRMRGLRHWTIHRAWMLYQRKLKEKEGLELEK